jgi:hypothetical protein
MSFSFRPAVRESVPLLIGLAGGTGSGKTYTAMRLASGISGGKPFCVIDTEAGRAKHYADEFKFDHGDLKPPFRPDNYIDAIMAADKAGYPVIVVDSMSHSWAGEGGMLDWQEEELTRMAGDDWSKRERSKMSAWIKPKHSHKQMVNKLLQVRAHVILCFRAEPKIEMVKKDGKTLIQEKTSLIGLNGWIPISDKNLPFELTASFLLMADRPGIPLPIKLQQQHRALFPSDKEINEESGKRLAQWAAGGSDKPVDNTAELRKLLTDANIPEADFLAAAQRTSLSEITNVDKAKQWIEKNRPKSADVLTFEDVEGKIKRADSLDVLEVAAEFIEMVPGATDQQRLTNLFAERRAEFKRPEEAPV